MEITFWKFVGWLFLAGIVIPMIWGILMAVVSIITAIIEYFKNQ